MRSRGKKQATFSYFFFLSLFRKFIIKRIGLRARVHLLCLHFATIVGCDKSRYQGTHTWIDMPSRESSIAATKRERSRLLVFIHVEALGLDCLFGRIPHLQVRSTQQEETHIEDTTLRFSDRLQTASFLSIYRYVYSKYNYKIERSRRSYRSFEGKMVDIKGVIKVHCTW